MRPAEYMRGVYEAVHRAKDQVAYSQLDIIWTNIAGATIRLTGTLNKAALLAASGG